MFSWLEGLVSSIASSIGGVFEGIGDTIVNAIWDNLVKWLFFILLFLLFSVFFYCLDGLSILFPSISFPRLMDFRVS